MKVYIEHVVRCLEFSLLAARTYKCVGLQIYMMLTPPKPFISDRKNGNPELDYLQGDCIVTDYFVMLLYGNNTLHHC